jgi:hypothetical protein
MASVANRMTTMRESFGHDTETGRTLRPPSDMRCSPWSSIGLGSSCPLPCGIALGGRQSQTLALIFLAAAVRAYPTLNWLPKAEMLGDHRLGLFEVELAEHVLNERPRQTQLDFLAVGTEGVIVVEAKFTEKGFGSCSCSGRDTGVCSVYDRPYWSVAKDELGQRERVQPETLQKVHQVAHLGPLHDVYRNEKGPVSGAFLSGSDGTRTRDLRRDRPAF